jgi:hypothetical protein
MKNAPGQHRKKYSGASVPLKRENPFAIFGYILGGVVLLCAAIGVFFGVAFAVLSVVQGKTGLLIILVAWALMIAGIGYGLKKWVG